MISLPLQRYIELFRPEELQNIDSFVHPVREWPKNWSCMASDWGGTNFRSAIVEFDGEGNTTLKDLFTCTMPGRETSLTIDELFDFYEERKRAHGATESGVCFSSPATILHDGTAVIRSFSKDLKISGAEGRIINESVINDATGVLMGTRGANMGLVLGTGFNIAYAKDDTIINSECGSFTGFPYEDFDYGPIAEMQVSGLYINPLLEKTKGIVPREEIIDRAAKIVAAQIYGIAKYAGISEARIAAEGSTFYKFTELHDRIEHYVDMLPLDIVFLDGRDTTLIGAATALYERRYSV